MDRQAVQERFGIIGSSDPLKRVIDRARQVAQTDITVLLEGESGVGKELFANAIHGMSRRRHQPFVVVNCGAIPEGLIEAELFGAEKGAYTGSVERRRGYFEEADGGTLFLDEIGELPVQAQVRLLRVLENGTFSRVGSSTQQQVDVRVIAATNKDIGQEVRAGRFREDLYYRLSTVVVRVPPVRSRPEDILPLFEHFLYRAAQKYDAPLRKLDAPARDLLRRYNWPGNVREMRNVAEQATVLLHGDTATADDLRPFLRGVSAAQGLALTSKEGGDGAGTRDLELVYRALMELRGELRDVRELLGRMAGGAGTLPPSFAPLASFPSVTFDDGALDSLPLRGGEQEAFAFVPEHEEAAYDGHFEDVSYEIEDEPAEAEPTGGERADDGSALRLGDGPLPTMEEAEQTLIAEALRRFDGNRRQTAQALGISERTLYRKIKDLETQEVEG